MSAGKIVAKVTVDTDELREWADKHADAGRHGAAHVLYAAARDAESLSEQAMREAKAAGNAEAQQGIETAILRDAPRLNAELRHDGTSDPIMAAYVEGFHDAYEAAKKWQPGGEHTDDCTLCAVRCESCGDRMCSKFGPEPAVRCAAHPTCVVCDRTEPVPCRDCMDAIRDSHEGSDW